MDIAVDIQSTSRVIQMSQVIITKQIMQRFLLCFYLCQTESNYFFPFIISQKKKCIQY